MEDDKPYREDRPWGHFLEFVRNQPVTVKILTVNSGEALSLQYHNYRDERWHVISGKGTVRIGEGENPIQVGENYLIKRGVTHRVSAGEESVVILEISLGEFNEGDIIRLEDRYNRIEQK